MEHANHWVGFDESLPEIGKLVLTRAKDGTIGATMRVRHHTFERFALCTLGDFDNIELGFWCDCVPGMCIMPMHGWGSRE